MMIKKRVKVTVFIDRDGTINKKALPHQYICKPEEVQLLEGAGEGISILNKCGYNVIVISNQRGVARGMMTAENLTAVTCKVEELLADSSAHVDEYYYCTHENGTCECRKPQIGLFFLAENSFQVDKHHSYMIGDTDVDIEAGLAYGVKTIRIGDNDKKAAYSCANLKEAAEWIRMKEGE